MNDAEKGVVFVLDTRIGESARANVQEFGKMLSDTQKQIDDLIASSSSRLSSVTSTASAMIEAASSKVNAVIQSAAAYAESLTSKASEALEKVTNSPANPFPNPMDPAYLKAFEDSYKKRQEIQKEALDKEVAAEVEAAQRKLDALEAARSVAESILSKPRDVIAPSPGGSQTPSGVPSSPVPVFDASGYSKSLQDLYDKRAEIQKRALDRELALEKEYQAKKDELWNSTKDLAAVMQELDNARIDGKIIDESDMDAVKDMIAYVEDLKNEFDKLESERTKRKEREARKREEAEEREVNKAIEAAEKKARRDAEIEKVSAERRARDAQREHDSLIEKARSARDSITERIAGLSEGLMKVVRGFVAVGLAGEEDLKKIAQTILQVQGGIDLLNGSLKTLQEMEKLWRNIQAAITAAAAAQKIYEAGGVRGVKGGTVARDVISGGIGGYVVGRAATYAASAAGTLRQGSRYVGAGVYGAAGSVGLGGLAVGGSLAGLAASGAAAGGGAMFGLTSAILSLKEAINNGIGGGASQGSFVDRVGSSNWNPFAVAAKATTSSWWNKSTEEARIARMESIRAANSEDRKRENDLLKEQVSLIAEISSRNMSRVSLAMESLTVEERRVKIAEEIKKVEGELAGLRGRDKEDLAENAKFEAAQARLIDWQKERLRNEKEIARIKSESATEELRNAERSYEAAVRARELAQSQSASAIERFGLMDSEEQTEITDIKKRFDAGGDLTPDEISKIRGFSRDTDDRISAWATSRANASGFADVFGSENENEIKRLEGIEEKLSLELKQKNEIVVTLENDADKLVSEIVSKIHEAIEDRDKILNEKLDQAVSDIGKIQDGIKTRSVGR